jgi:hypothetical protein
MPETVPKSPTPCLFELKLLSLWYEKTILIPVKEIHQDRITTNGNLSGVVVPNEI